MTLAAVCAKVDDGFARFFREHGFEVDWDFSKRDGAHWYEINLNGKMLCQVDMHTPLAEFLADLPVFAAGDQNTRGIGSTAYKCYGPHANIVALYAHLKAAGVWP
jgi:hypothetical protein